MHKKYRILLSITLIIFIFYSVGFAYDKFNTTYYEGYEPISLEDIEIGDIVVAQSDWLSAWVPGYWSHSSIVVDIVNETPMVIESLYFKGVQLVTLEKFRRYHYEYAIAKVNTNKETKLKAVQWAKSQIGKKFNYFIFGKSKKREKY